jgi:signal transduction histidine kinase
MPQLTLDLSDEAYARLSARARFHEQALESYAATALDSGLATWEREALARISSLLTGIQALVQDRACQETTDTHTARRALFKKLDHQLSYMQALLQHSAPLSYLSKRSRYMGERNLKHVVLRELVERVVEHTKTAPAWQEEHRLSYWPKDPLPEWIIIDVEWLNLTLETLLHDIARLSPRGDRITLTVDLPTNETLRFTITCHALDVVSKLHPHIAQALVRFFDGQLTLSTDAQKGTIISVTLPLQQSIPVADDEEFKEAKHRLHERLRRLQILSEGIDAVAESYFTFNNNARLHCIALVNDELHDLQETLQSLVTHLTGDEDATDHR